MDGEKYKTLRYPLPTNTVGKYLTKNYKADFLTNAYCAFSQYLQELSSLRYLVCNVSKFGLHTG
jgi:hypothetical protein